MKYLKYKCLLAIILGCSLSGCFDLTEEVFDRVDSGVYYQDENSVKSAVATIYSTGATSYAEYFWYMQEFPADQVTWRVWNGGQWGYDEGEKFIFSIQNWTPDYKTQNKLSVNYKTFCTDFTSINIKQNVNLEYKNKYFYICN